ncbi:hypothetical protein [Aureimonas psammosilenae]|uniref:hypothetical protein n=1 Tax=Aureimonas psammosilenae TaxID=2495496 RepID=UPI0012609F42|nr:hypothetical protein [Aureimonas psammosilenae]
MSQTLASPRRPIINRFCEKDYAGPMIWLIAVATCVGFSMFMAGILFTIMANDAATRVQVATQEYGSVAPRGMAGRVSLASKEMGQ